MGVDLHGRGRYYAANWHTWRELLDVAELFGWKPSGTILNPDYEHVFDILSRPEDAEVPLTNGFRRNWSRRACRG